MKKRSASEGVRRGAKAGSGLEGAARRYGQAPTPVGPAPSAKMSSLAPQQAGEAGEAAKGRHGRRRGQRPLFRAEQVMERRQQPMKRYLATQRIRRDVERARAESLALDVNFLKQEIAELETVRDILRSNRLAARATTVCNLMAVVHEYFGKIQHGFGRETSASSVTLAQKVDFLRSVFDENVDFGTGGRGRGLDAFIAQCQAYTLFHASFYYEPPTLTQVSPTDEDHTVIVVSRNRLRVRVSRQTIEVMFPHLLQDEAMVQALIGSEIVYPCVITVFFDHRGRVVRHDAEVDFVSGLSAALKSLDEVGRVMSNARLHGSIIVYDASVSQTKDPLLPSAEPQRPYEIATTPTDAPYHDHYSNNEEEEEEKRLPQPQEVPSPVHTPTTSDELAGQQESLELYASPPSTHAHFAGANSSELTAALYEQSHTSPSKEPAKQSKESVTSRMSIHSLLS